MKIPILIISIVIVITADSKSDYWHELFQDFGKSKFFKNKEIRSHCGKNNYDNPPIVKRIVGGNGSKKAEWPWLVSLMLWTPDENITTQYKSKHICGGTLISKSWILTAAHCFEKKWDKYLTNDPTKWTARLGEHSLLETEDHQVDHSIKRIFIHQSRNKDKKENYDDIALLKLEKPVEFTSFIKPACLPYPNEKFYAQMHCTAIGWGHTSNGGKLAEIPHHVSLELISFNDCKSLYDVLMILTEDTCFNVTKDMLCAGKGDGKDSCQFDSGGPLLCKSNLDNSWIVAGIVSFGFNCGDNFPGIYTRVTNYIDWIKKIISKY